MSSTKFQPLKQGEDYGLNSFGLSNFSLEPLESSRAMDDPTDGSQGPVRWYSKKGIKSAYTPQVTYVSAPNDEKKPLKTKGRRQSSRLSFIKSNPVSNLRIPTFAAPWQHDVPEGLQPTKSTTVRYFSASKQWRRIFVNGLIQWFITFFLVLCQWATIFGFSQKEIMHRGHKYTFNALTTLLSLCIGLSVVSALRSYAKLMSWRFLASKYRDLQDFELIMNCNSQTKVLKLLWAGRDAGKFRLNKTQMLCLLSLFLVIGLQITIGLLGLTYSIDTSTVNDHIWGSIYTADLSNIYQDVNYNSNEFSSQAGSANYYGNVGFYYNQYNASLGEGRHGYEWVYYLTNDTAEYSTTYYYNFVNMAHNNESSPLSESTDRWVSAAATCAELEIIEGGTVDPDDGSSTVTYRDEDGQNKTLSFEEQSIFTSTYLSDNSTSNCGPRCANILIYDVGTYTNGTGDAANNTDTAPHIFTCNSTVSEIHNTDSCHDPANCTLSDVLAKILAGSIGWSGSTDPDPIQSQSYPRGSPLSWDGYSTFSDATVRAYLISKFTIGALAAMDNGWSAITQEGPVPVPGVTLTVKWQYAAPVLLVIPSVQFVLLVIVCIWANGALIKDGSFLGTARMLRPVVEKLEEHGCALTGVFYL